MNYKNLGTPHKTDSLALYNCDCMELLKQTPDDYYDLCVVDPPYGIGHSTTAGKQSGTKYGKASAPKGVYAEKNWDDSTPDAAYFDELRRVSENQIIWGANYMTQHLQPSMGWIAWDKNNGNNGFSDCELAYTSFKRGLRMYKYTWNGMIQGDMKNKEKRIHATQKPVKLYDWIFANYATEGMSILDTHMGSGSIAIAAHYAGMHLTACELDEDYYKAACEWVKRETSQQAFDFITPDDEKQIDTMELLE